MALSSSALPALIQSNIQSQFGSAPDNAAQLQKFADAVAQAVVAHIQAAALVTLTTAVVTSGAGAGGVVSGNGTVG